MDSLALLHELEHLENWLRIHFCKTKKRLRSLSVFLLPVSNWPNNIH